MKRLHLLVFVLISLALVQLACNAPAPIPLTGGGATLTPVRLTPGALATVTPNGTPGAACTNKMTFVSDVNVPDNTVISAGQTFTKTWRVKNDGTCAWGPNQPASTLVFTGGDPLGAPKQVALTGIVQPGQTADLSILFTAPAQSGTYISQWMLLATNATGDNQMVGVGNNGKGALYVQIVVK